MAADKEAPSGPSPSSPKVVAADNVQVHNGHLTWTASTPDFQLSIDNVLLILPSVTKGQGFIICCLREATGESVPPFELVLLRSDEVPDQLAQAHLINKLPSHLHSDIGRQVDILVSTNSGTGLASSFWGHVLQPLWKLVQEEFGTPSEAQDNILMTQDADSVPNFARRLWSSASESPNDVVKSRTIVLLSGDGGVVDLLNGRDDDILRTPLPLIALLPLGTGNALFHSLHKPAYSSPGPSPLVLALRTLFQGSPADLPVFRASFSPGAHVVPPGSSSAVGDDGQLADAKVHPVSHLDGAIVASYGFHASLVYESDTPEHRVHGAKRFGMVAQELLRESHPYTAHVEVRRPGSSGLEALPREEHAYVLTTMVSNLERAFTISPASKPLDGQLRTVHFGNIGGVRAMEAMQGAYDGGKHVDAKWDDGERVYYEDVDEIKITIKDKAARWRKVCVDGTTVEVPAGGQMTVKRLEKTPLQVLVNPSVLKGA
ncbi:hypothetical protein ACO1O0_002937 [Amphichorda felina]